MTLQDLIKKELNEGLTPNEKRMKKVLEKEEKLKADFAKIKEEKKKINAQNKKKRTHSLIVIASEIMKGYDDKEIEKLALMSKNNKDMFFKNIKMIIDKNQE